MDSFISEYGHVHGCKQGFQAINSNIMTNSVDSIETAS